MRDSPPAADIYHWHRTALAPLLPGAAREVVWQACAEAQAIGTQRYLRFLRGQGLAPLWDRALADCGAPPTLAPEFVDGLRAERLRATANYLGQRHRLPEIRHLLDGAGITHVVYKGADIRERLYREPALRPAADIDLLVPAPEKVAAIRALRRGGFELEAVARNVSHEVSLLRGMTAIDLHWDILRVGRTRVPMVPRLLSTRRDCGSHWGLGDEASLFVMLVHPVFAKYVSTPHATLARSLDLARLMATPIDWPQVEVLLASAGLRTAAWLSLRWHGMLAGTTAPPEFVDAIAPGHLKRRYLDLWLRRNYATALLDRPGLVQFGLTLPAHDRWADALRALRAAFALRRSAAADLDALLANTEV